MADNSFLVRHHELRTLQLTEKNGCNRAVQMQHKAETRINLPRPFSFPPPPRLARQRPASMPAAFPPPPSDHCKPPSSPPLFSARTSPHMPRRCLATSGSFAP